MTRRSLIKTLISAAAGSVLAKLPLAGWKDTTPRLIGRVPDNSTLVDDIFAYKALDEFFARAIAQREDETFMLYQRGEL